MRKFWLAFAIATAAIAPVGCSAPSYAQETVAPAVPDKTPIDLNKCNSREEVQNLADKLNADRPKDKPKIELSFIEKGESLGSEVAAQRGVKAFNTVFDINAAGDGIVVFYIVDEDRYVIGLIEGAAVCLPHRMTADEFSAFQHLAGDPIA